MMHGCNPKDIYMITSHKGGYAMLWCSTCGAVRHATTCTWQFPREVIEKQKAK